MRALRSAGAMTGAAVLLTASALLVGATPAGAAEPITSTASIPSGTVAATYSDTVISPGETVTASITFTNTSTTTGDYSYRAELDPYFDLGTCIGEPGQAIACGTVGSNGRDIKAVGLAPGSTTITVDLTLHEDIPEGAFSVFQEFVRGKETSQTFSPELFFTVPPAVPDEADVGVNLSASSGLLSSQINYGLQIDNDGPSDATGVQIVVDLPTQTSGVTGLPTACTYSASNDEVTCTYGLIAAGGSRTASFTATIGLLSIGQLPATATRVGSTPIDPNAANDTSSADCTVLTSLIIACN